MFFDKETGKRRSDTNGTFYVDSIRNIQYLGEQRASFSVEASLIIPLVLMCMFIPIWLGIEMNEEIKTWVEIQSQTEVMDMISSMYRQDFLKDMGGDSNEN